MKTLIQITLATLLVAQAGAQEFAVRAARVHTGTGAALENATVHVKDGRIHAVGAGLELPEGVHLVEHPGELSAGMIALRDLAGTAGEHSDSTRAMLPAGELRHAFDPDHRQLEALLAEGITAFQIGADPRALVGGMTAVVKTSGGKVVHPRCHLAVTLSGEALLANRYPTSYAAAVDELGARIEEGAGTFAAVKAKNLPLMVRVRERHEVLRALDLLGAHGLTGLFEGADRIGELAQHLAGKGVGVALPAFSLGETWHPARSSVALAEAGVPFGFALGSPENHPSALRLSAAASMRAGLDPSRAWAALTTDAARLCRSEQRIGSLAAGLDADLVLWSGSPLDLASRVLTVYVDGERAYDLPAEQRKKIIKALEEEPDQLPPGVTPGGDEGDDQ